MNARLEEAIAMCAGRSYRECVICGGPVFKPSSKKITCSQECREKKKRETTRAWAARNPEKIKGYDRSRYWRRPEYYREWQRRYRAEHPELIAERNRKNHAKHREERAEYARRYQAKHGDILRVKKRDTARAARAALRVLRRMAKELTNDHI